ncbi:hypothetical protein ACIQF6_20275 [Kitasatospora sp. NPDC092948]|uniref:hypothetical protein n=1 Tax=Kitasatospora sp. NPDC092948 TaxID=3364088 RepID=UPI003825A4DF
MKSWAERQRDRERRRRAVGRWGLAIGWVALCGVAPILGLFLLLYLGLLVGPILFGTVPGVCLGLSLGRDRAWAALAAAALAGCAVLPAVAAGLRIWTSERDLEWLWALVAAGAVLYTLPLLIAGGTGAWLTARQRRRDG